MLIKKNALMGICLAIYLIVWLVLLCVYLFKVYRPKKINVHKTALFYFLTVVWRHWGWFGALLLFVFFSSTLPTISVVTQDFDRKIAEQKALEKKYDWFTADSTFLPHQAFYYDEYYFLFSYMGRKSFGRNFIHNKTDSVLNLYKTQMSLAGPLYVDNEGIIIQPHELQTLSVDIDTKFSFPSTYVEKGKLYRETWTLDTKNEAQKEKNKIRKKIERTKNLQKGNLKEVMYTPF